MSIPKHSQLLWPEQQIQIGQAENLPPRETCMTTQAKEVVPQRNMRELLPEIRS